MLNMARDVRRAEFEVLRDRDQGDRGLNQTILFDQVFRLFGESSSEERVVHSLWVVLNLLMTWRQGFYARRRQGNARRRRSPDDDQRLRRSEPRRQQGPSPTSGSARPAMLHDLDRLVYELVGHDRHISNTPPEAFSSVSLTGAERSAKRSGTARRPRPEPMDSLPVVIPLWREGPRRAAL